MKNVSIVVASSDGQLLLDKPLRDAGSLALCKMMVPNVSLRGKCSRLHYGIGLLYYILRLYGRIAEDGAGGSYGFSALRPGTLVWSEKAAIPDVIDCDYVRNVLERWNERVAGSDRLP